MGKCPIRGPKGTLTPPPGLPESADLRHREPLTVPTSPQLPPSVLLHSGERQKRSPTCKWVAAQTMAISIIVLLPKVTARVVLTNQVAHKRSTQGIVCLTRRDSMGPSASTVSSKGMQRQIIDVDPDLPTPVRRIVLRVVPAREMPAQAPGQQHCPRCSC